MLPKMFAVAMLSIPCVLDAPAVQAQVLSPQGYGKVRFGDSIARAQARVHQRARPAKREAACDYVRFSKYPGITFMVEKGIVTRAESRQGWISNSMRIKQGTSIDEIRKRFPAIVTTPHKYDEDGHYLTLGSADGRKALVFEASKDKVNTVRGGLKPSVEYVEGCL
jgi:hypothetical protein